MCVLLVANVTRSQQPYPSYRKRKSQTIISQDFLVSVGLAKWGLYTAWQPLNLRVFGKQSSTEPAVLTDSLESL